MSRFHVLSYATPTLNRTAHIQPTTTIMCKVHFEILCLHATKLELSCFDGIIMRHTTSGCTYKRDVSRRPCFASRQPSEPVLDAGVPPEKYVLLCLSKAVLSIHAITIAELKAFMLRYCSQWHSWQQMATECRSNGLVSLYLLCAPRDDRTHTSSLTRFCTHAADTASDNVQGCTQISCAHAACQT